MIDIVFKGWLATAEHTGLGRGLAHKINKVNDVQEAVEGVLLFARAYRVAGKAARLAIDKGTDKMVTDIKAGVPVDRGDLQESIRKETTEKGFVIRAGGTPETMRPYGNGSTFDEAVAVEFGTTKMPARPYFYPIVDRAPAALQAGVRKAVDTAVSDLGD